jgi:hypothetical protein
MQYGKRIAVMLVSACCLIGLGAAGGSLLTAGAAQTSSKATPRSNESKAREAGESAAREAAESNGTAGCDHHADGDHDGGRGASNEDPGHEAGESAEREAEEGASGTTPSPSPSGSAGAGT